jgi:hypothetical protein
MLQRLDADTYQTNVGDTVTIVAQSDDGAPSATFRYVQKLQTKQIQGNPGCTFDIVEGRKMFSCAVVFGQGPAPRYDLFEVDANGALVDLEFPITPDMGPSAQFRIEGVGVAVLAAAPRSGGTRKPAKKKAAPKKAAKKVGKASSRKASKKSSNSGTRRARTTGRRPASGKRARGRR